MTDPLNAAESTAAIVSDLKQAIDAIEAKARESQDAELLRTVISAQSKVFDVQNALHDRDERIRDLEGELR